MNRSPISRIAVIGTGTWGTAMAAHLCTRCAEVRLWGRDPQLIATIQEKRVNPKHLSDLCLPQNLYASSHLVESIDQVEALVLAVPSSYVRAVARQLHDAGLSDDIPVLILSKGLEAQSHKLMHEVVAEEIGAEGRLAILSGPNHAEEVVQGRITCAVVASKNPDIAQLFQTTLTSATFRVYGAQDLVGIELCGALKNIIALGAGIAVGLGAGDNTLAALMTRGIAEIGRFVARLGGDPQTCMGLAGMGDLVVTCTSRHSRNRSFGEALVAGTDLESYEKSTGMVVEGARATQAAYELAKSLEIEAPITYAVYSVLYTHVPPQTAFGQLMERAPREEFYDMQGFGRTCHERD